MSEEAKIRAQEFNAVFGAPLPGTPNFPGIPYSAEATQRQVQAIRKFIKNQKRARGYNFDLPAGVSKNNIDLSGTAKFLLGFAVNVADDLTLGDFVIDLLVNNEVILENVDAGFLTQGFTNEEYYFFPRPLSGSDSINLRINTLAAATFGIVFYYI